MPLQVMGIDTSADESTFSDAIIIGFVEMDSEGRTYTTDQAMTLSSRQTVEQFSRGGDKRSAAV